MEQPVARVLPLLGVPHLDRLFDYAVPEDMDAHAQPGVRVRVRFSGRLVDAFLIERRRRSDHPGQLRPLERVISPIRVLPKPLWELVNTLADRYAGVRSDILRSVVPSRHASAEASGLFADGAAWEDLGAKLQSVEEAATQSYTAAETALAPYTHGAAFLSALVAGKPARSCLLTPPGSDIPTLIAAVAAAVAWNTDGSVLVVAPNQRLVDRLVAGLKEHMNPAQVLEMTASIGPNARYRRYLSVLAGQARVVVGTRSAALLPMVKPRLMVLVGESDDNLVDPRAPYIHAREALALHADHSGAGLLIAGVHRSAEVQQWVDRKLVYPLAPLPEVLREAMPWIRGLGETDGATERELHAPGARIPSMAFEAIRECMERNVPALVQVPRRGYAPALNCAKCRTPARCRHCNGPLELPTSAEAAPPRCRWCGQTAGLFTCSSCGNHSVRLAVVGHDRTVEELGRAFPGIPIIASGGKNVVDQVRLRKSIVVATPGAEPTVDRGLYGSAVLVDPWILLGRQDLRAAETALRHWMEAAALVAPRTEGGKVIFAGAANLPTAQQLIRWDPVGSARAELAHRAEAAFPPAYSVAAIDGTVASIENLEAGWELPEGAETLGPVELPQGVRLPVGIDSHDPQARQSARRLLVRVPAEHQAELGQALRRAQSVRTIHRSGRGPQPDALRVVMDPVRIG
ncbi:primosomal protein N' [Corynebacterium macclintockiae]|uniref:primosomal protein N' n=1 Tax=Corynebacterium macclintockiae TaxID=2913501 RepID=UPI003EBA9A55